MRAEGTFEVAAWEEDAGSWWEAQRRAAATMTGSMAPDLRAWLVSGRLTVW